VNWIELCVLAVAIFAAACLQASIGFGMGMLVAPVLAVIEPQLVPGTIIVLALFLTTMVTVRERHSLDLHGAAWALVGRLPGSIAGAWLVVTIPADGLAWLVAAVVLGGVLMAFLGWAPHPGRRNLVIAGAASGLMGTSTSIGGAPMAIVWQGLHGSQLRGTMSAFFLVGTTMSFFALLASGALDTQIVRVAALMLPAVLGGYLVSRLVNRTLDRRRLRLTALTASASGAVLVIIVQLASLTGGPM